VAAAQKPDSLLPHEVFAIQLDDIRGGIGIDAARAVAWRYLIGVDSGIPQIADVGEGPTGHKVTAVRRGRSVGATVEAIQKLEADPRVANGSYEMRLLLFPAGRFRSLWLCDAAIPNHAGDLFYPLNDPIRGLPDPIGELLSYDQMNNLLTRVAKTVITPPSGTGPTAAQGA
jgi:hypothetical protein